MSVYFKKNTRHIVFLLITAIGHNLLSMKLQLMKGDILDIAIAGHSEKILGFVLLFAFFLVAQLSLQQLSVLSRIKISTNIVRDIKNELFESLSNRHISSIDKVAKSDFLARYTTDIQTIDGNFLAMGGRLFEHATVILISGITLFLVNYKIALLTFAVFIIPMFITKALKSTISKAEKNYIAVNQGHIDKLLKNLKGLEAIKNYSIEKEIDGHYSRSLDELTGADMKRALKRSLANGMSYLTTMVSQAAILIYSSYLLYLGEITAGVFVTIFSLVIVLRPPFYWISQLYESVIASRPAIHNVMNTIKENRENSEEKLTHLNVLSSETLKEGEVEIKDLSYSYEKGRKIVDKLNLHIKKGDKVLISGPSGSGKSTLIKLIIGRLIPGEGRVELGSPFSYFKQDAFLFRATFRDNITMFRQDYSEEELEKVSRTCGLEELYLQNKCIEEKGANLSGGEKKRLSLARSMLDNQSIWILDEPYANIDSDNIAAIEQAILQDKEHTLIIVSHIVSDRLRAAVDHIVDMGPSQAARN